jgi:ABC-2 type transport system ATP-binding protein
MTRSSSKARLVCVALIFALMITVGLTFVCDSSLHCGVLNVAAQASQASGSTTVMNNVTVSANPISLGSTLRANGQASTASGPLANASVALHMGDATLAHTQTDSKGGYAFAVPVGAYYFPAALHNGATLYTAVEPLNSSFIETPSAVTSVAVDLFPLFAVIVLITGSIVLGLYVYARRLRGKAVWGAPFKRRAPLKRRAKQVAEQTVTMAAEASQPERPALNQEQPTTLVHETPQRSVKGVAMGESAMKAEHLTKKFGHVTIVDDLNLEIKHGEVFGFLGPNGAGKTTSIKMMTGLLQPTSGRVLFNGAELGSMQKKKIGVCPQELVLWEALTCRENLTFMGNMYGVEKRALENRVNELLDYLSLTDKADQPASKLSGGMKRRLNVALSVVHHPEIVFLDEPSAGLDPQTRQLLWDFIRALRDKEGKTVILTTHVMEEADALSDRVAIIDHGKLLLLNTPDALKKTMGRGDVVELQLGDIAMNDAIIQRVSTLDGIEEAYELKDRVAVRALNAPSKLPELVDLIEGAGGSVCDVTIRGNTLEDVFIYLTGRALRE